VRFQRQFKDRAAHGTRFLGENGLDLGLFVDQLLADRISSFFAVDVTITALVLIATKRQEARRRQMGNWWAFIVVFLLVGPSVALPLFLYVREGLLSSSANPPPQ
jgi:hypothetical protein